MASRARRRVWGWEEVAWESRDCSPSGTWAHAAGMRRLLPMRRELRAMGAAGRKAGAGGVMVGGRSGCLLFVVQIKTETGVDGLLSRATWSIIQGNYMSARCIFAWWRFLRQVAQLVL